MNLASVWLELDGGDQEATRQGRTASAWSPECSEWWGPNTVLLCADAAGGETRTHDATLRSGRPCPPGSQCSPSGISPRPPTTKIAPHLKSAQVQHQPRSATAELRKASIGCKLNFQAFLTAADLIKIASQCQSKAGGAMRLLR